MTKDLISRQAAISLAGDLQIHGDEYHMYNQAINNYCTEIMGLPSAQPEIVRCKDCKHHDGIRCFRWNSTIITGFDDFCSNAERRSEEE